MAEIKPSWMWPGCHMGLTLHWGGCCGVRQNQDVVSRRPVHRVREGKVELVEL